MVPKVGSSRVPSRFPPEVLNGPLYNSQVRNTENLHMEQKNKLKHGDNSGVQYDSVPLCGLNTGETAKK